MCRCSRVTRSSTAAKTAKSRRALTGRNAALSRPRCAPVSYWMRRHRPLSTDVKNSGTVVTGLLEVPDQATDAGSGDDGCRPSVCVSHSNDCGAEPATSSPSTRKMRTCDSHSVTNQSCHLTSNVLSRVKSSDGRNVIGSETSSRLLESNSIDGHSSTAEGHSSSSRSSGENTHHRLHCSDGGECCLCMTDSVDNALLCEPADCNRCQCLKMSSANTHVDRPWVSTEHIVQWLRSSLAVTAIKTVYLFSFDTGLCLRL